MTPLTIETKERSHPVQRDVTAFVLTGGKSERMGQDKAALRLASGRTLLENALAVAGAVTGQVGIVGPRQKYGTYAWAGEIVEDIFPGHGPLGGIHAALSASTTEWNIILAVDLPNVSAALLEWLLSVAQISAALVTVASIRRGLQPLCGVYRKSFRDLAEQALQKNHNKVDSSFDRNSLRILTEEEIRAAGFDESMFVNVNTPEEFEKLAVGN